VWEELKVDDQIANVILEDLQIKYEKEQAWDDVDLVDADDVDLFETLDLEKKVTKLKEDFTMMLKAKKAKQVKDPEVNKEVVSLSSDKGLEVDDEDIVCLYDVKYPLTNAEIRMFKERPTTSRGPRRQLASTYTRSRAPISSTSRRQPRPRCVLALFTPNAPPPFPHKKRSPILRHMLVYLFSLLYFLNTFDDVLDV
ncbi:hypothetical protein Tco_1380560, partial [Tanacetum coccineum]